MRLKKGEYYWASIDNKLEVIQWDGHAWECIGRDFRVHKSIIKPLEHIKKPGVV